MKGLALILAFTCLFAGAAPTAPKPWISLSKETESFVVQGSNTPFTPWGFNYDRDYKFRLLEEYWEKEWDTVLQDFREMKDLGANVVRVHLQFDRFIDAPGKPNQANLARLEKLIRYAEQLGLYLDLTGLGSYRNADPKWYDSLSEQDRWAAQADFWKAIAKTCADRPGVFCYNLMNEPVVAGGKETNWIHQAALGGLYYVQFVNKDIAGRQRADVAKKWIQTLTPAIRQFDRRHLITVGIMVIPLGPPEEAAGFPPSKIAPEIDFFSLHIYPETGKVTSSLDVLKRCKPLGKPLVIEEIFPLNCAAKVLGNFIDDSREYARGWIGFYWGQTPAELKASSKLESQLTLSWLELFQAKNPNR